MQITLATRRAEEKKINYEIFKMGIRIKAREIQSKMFFIIFFALIGSINIKFQQYRQIESIHTCIV
jgi:hypothetical protein